MPTKWPPEGAPFNEPMPQSATTLSPGANGDAVLNAITQARNEMGATLQGLMLTQTRALRNPNRPADYAMLNMLVARLQILLEDTWTR